MEIRRSYIHLTSTNRILYTGKKTSLYWIRPQIFQCIWCNSAYRAAIAMTEDRAHSELSRDCIYCPRWVITMWCCYNMVSFLQNNHNRHFIAHPWVQSLINFCWRNCIVVCKIIIYSTTLWWHQLYVSSESIQKRNNHSITRYNYDVVSNIIIPLIWWKNKVNICCWEHCFILVDVNGNPWSLCQ